MSAEHKRENEQKFIREYGVIPVARGEKQDKNGDDQKHAADESGDTETKKGCGLVFHRTLTTMLVIKDTAVVIRKIWK